MHSLFAAVVFAVVFQAPVRYPASADQALLVRDLDHDGAPDILVSGNHVDEAPAFSLLSNRGDGTFENERLLPSGFGETLQDAGDLNGDGVPDLVASNYWANGIAVYTPGRTAYDTATHGGPTRILDYDGDGTSDIVTLSFGSGNRVRAHLFRGRGDGTLEPKTTFDTDLANGASLSARTDRGAVELLVSERSGQLGLIRVANGTVTTTRLPAGVGFDLGCVFADVNGDGIMDIIDTTDAESSSEAVFVSLGRADGTFDAPQQIEQPRHLAFPVQVRAGDLDRDGLVDLVVSDFHSTNLYWFRGDGTGRFAEAIAIPAGGPVNDFSLVDLNGDGLLDLVTANDDHSIAVVVTRSIRQRTVRH